MNRKAALTILLFSISLFLIAGLSGCTGPQQKKTTVGGPCDYKNINGTAHIIAIEPATRGPNNCKNPVSVVFNFMPLDGAANQANISYTNQRLTLGEGQNPPRAWVDSQGIKVGSRLRCVRQEIETGTCTPIIYSFPSLNYSGWENACWGK